MKEERFFYDPLVSGELPQEEAHHAVKVLRLQTGDEIWLMDGSGTFYRATITATTGHRCSYRIEETLPQERAWEGQIHLATAPTKLMDRVEWFAEKATEIGFDELSFLDCQFSERRVVKEERIDKILISAMKQSHKAWKPQLNEVTPFQKFITRPDLPPQRFIAHCYDPADIAATIRLTSTPWASGPEPPPSLSHSVATVPEVFPSGHSPSSRLPFLLDLLAPCTPALVLIGPEGDFSIDEVRMAEAAGFRSVSLGTSRLRTETAALVAVHLMRLANR